MAVITGCLQRHDDIYGYRGSTLFDVRAVLYVFVRVRKVEASVLLVLETP